MESVWYLDGYIEYKTGKNECLEVSRKEVRIKSSEADGLALNVRNLNQS